MLASPPPAPNLGSSRAKQPLIPPPLPTGKPREVPSTDQQDDAMSARTVSSRDHRSAHLRINPAHHHHVVSHATDSSWRFLHPSGDYKLGDGPHPLTTSSPTTRHPHPPVQPPPVVLSAPSVSKASMIEEAEAALTSVLQQASASAAMPISVPNQDWHAASPVKALSRLSALSQLSYLHADGVKGKPSPHRGVTSSLAHATQRLARSTIAITEVLMRKPQQQRQTSYSAREGITQPLYPTLHVLDHYGNIGGTGNSPKGRLLQDMAHHQQKHLTTHGEGGNGPQLISPNPFLPAGPSQLGSHLMSHLGSQEFTDDGPPNPTNPSARTPQPLELDQLLEALTRSANKPSALSVAESVSGSGVFPRDQTSPSFASKVAARVVPPNGSTSPASTAKSLGLQRRNSRNNMSRSKALDVKSLQSHHKMYTLLDTATDTCMSDILDAVPLLTAEDLPEEEALTLRMDLQRLYVTLHPFDHIVPASGVPGELLHTIAHTIDTPVDLLVEDHVKYLTIQAATTTSVKTILGSGGAVTPARHHTGDHVVSPRGSIATTNIPLSPSSKRQGRSVLDVSSVPKHLPLYVASKVLDVVTHRMWHHVPGRVDPTKLVGSRNYDDRNRLLNILRAKQREAEVLLGIRTTYAKIAPPLLPDDEDMDYEDAPRAMTTARASPMHSTTVGRRASIAPTSYEGMRPLHEIRLDDLEDVAKTCNGKLMDVFHMLEDLRRTKRRRSNVPTAASLSRMSRGGGRSMGGMSSDDETT